MSKSILWLYCILFCVNISTIYAQTIPIEGAFTETFESPVGIEYSHEGSNLLYFVRKTGFVDIKNLENPDKASTNFIDISDRIGNPFGEMGLLGLAFSPNYPEDETFYLYYTFRESGGDRDYYSTLARYKAPGGIADPDSEERLFELLQPQDNHNGGQIEFGPDGYLYVAVGDGGRESRDLAQNTQVLNGSILRIDVSSETGYEIPPDNPFVGDPAGLDEIYAWGLRNPWRISFDPETGNLWAADVGEEDREAIYIIDKGKNYGWPIIEGTVCVPVESDCDKTGLELPVFEYEYSDRIGKSITGGYVYRGDKNPSLYGKYIYGDFITRKIWALEIDHETKEVISNTEIAEAEQNLPTFGVDGFGEIYIGGWGDGAKIYRFVPELTFTTLSLNTPDGSSSVQLNWEVNQDFGIDSFELFRGSSMDNMKLYNTIGGGKRQFSDPEPLNGATFYAVRAVETDGDAGELSNPVSFYRAQETLSDSWQLTSIPFETEGLNVSDAIFYSFDGSYVAADQLVPGLGYWARSTVQGGIEFTGKGAGVLSFTMQLREGWNLIGAPVSTIRVESIIDKGSILSSTPIYGFNGTNLRESETISPGEGYWIYAAEKGNITIDLEREPLQLPLITANTSRQDYSETFDMFVFTSKNSTAEMYAAKGAVTTDLKDRYRVPPISPNPVLDVRTADGFKLVESDRFEFDITASEYPLSVQFNPAKDTNDFSSTNSDDAYEVTVWRGGLPETSMLTSESTMTLSEPVDRIEFLRVEVRDEIVRETELLPSYPNPFNPVTTISYRLSEQQQVTLTVFDAAGRRIATLVDSEQDAGQYTLPYDASGLASGIYFVRFSAGDVLSTQKLTLIK